MYKVYQTEALIVESKPHHEADKILTILTRNFGMIRAHARGVRHLKSKLRFSLQEMSFAEIAIVRGRDFWRIVNAVPAWNAYATLKQHRSRRELAARVLKLLKRLLSGEEGNPELFDLISEAFAFLSSEKNSDVKNFEAVLVLRILHRLGYVGDSAALRQFLFGTDFTADLISSMDPLRKDAVQYINQSLKETNL
jgi:DNA repair protein RecO (recombination protein O)